EIEARLAVDDADAHGGDAALDGRRRETTARHQPRERVAHGDAGAGDRRRARAAVGLQHIAVDLERDLAEPKVIQHRAQAAADESLNLLRAPANLRPLARRARVRGAWQHRVLRGEPAFAASFAPARYALFDACRAQHARRSEGDETGSFGVRRGAAIERDEAKVVRAASGARCGCVRWHHEAIGWCWW